MEKYILNKLDPNTQTYKEVLCDVVVVGFSVETEDSHDQDEHMIDTLMRDSIVNIESQKVRRRKNKNK